MGFFDGVQETFGDIGDAFLSLIGKKKRGNTQKEYEEDFKKVKEQEQKPWYDSPVKTMTGVNTTQIQSIVSWLIVGLLIFLLIRD